MRKHWATVGCILLLPIITGCGPKVPEGRRAISGTITINGSPVKSGAIRFQALTPTGSSGGAVIIDGKYTIPALGGLTDGQYRVNISAPETNNTPEGKPLPPGSSHYVAKELIPPEYNINSTKTIEVRPDGPYVYDFDITNTGR